MSASLIAAVRLRVACQKYDASNARSNGSGPRLRSSGWALAGAPTQSIAPNRRGSL